MRKLTESMETVLEYLATGIAPVDMAREGSRSFAVSFEGLRRRGLVEQDESGGASLTGEGSAYWAKKTAPKTMEALAELVEVVKAKKSAVPAVVVEQGDRVRNAAGVLGKVLEIGQRAGVAVVAVAFGAALVWMKMAELVAA